MEDTDFLFPILAEDVVSVPDWEWTDPTTFGGAEVQGEVESPEPEVGSAHTSPWNESDSGWSSLSSPLHMYPQFGFDVMPDLVRDKNLDEILEQMDIDPEISDAFIGVSDVDNKSDIVVDNVVKKVNVTENTDCSSADSRPFDISTISPCSTNNECDSNGLNSGVVFVKPIDSNKTAETQTNTTNMTKGRLFRVVTQRHNYALDPSTSVPNLPIKNIRDSNINSTHSQSYQQKQSNIRVVNASKRARYEDDIDNGDYNNNKHRTNAENAKMNREKKKAYIQNLEDQVNELLTERRELKDRADELSDETSSLRDEVAYLRSVIVNDSCLAKLITNIPHEKPVSLKSFRKRKFDNRIAAAKSSGGVCLHVCKEQVSLEFCATCAKNAMDSTDS